MTEKPGKNYLLFHRIGEERVYKPSTDISGNPCTAPLDEGHAKLDGESELILVDLEPIFGNIGEILKRMRIDSNGCKETVKSYSGTVEGKAYAQAFDLSARYLDTYLKMFQKALPQLSNSE